MAAQICGIELIGVPSHVEEELDGVLHRLQITYVEDPHLIDTVLIGEVHLFPQTGDRTDVDPFRIARPAHVIHMVIHSKASLALLGSAQGWQTTDVTPVIVTE